MYTKKKHEEMSIIGIKIRTSNEHHSKDGPRLWDRFRKEQLMTKIPNKLNENIFAVYTDYEGDYTRPYSYLVGCEVAKIDEVPRGLVGIKIPRQNYAVFSAKGSFPVSLIQTWQQIWVSDIQRSYFADFEVYPPHFDPQKQSDIQIHIAIT